jgi:hypothetical protein
MIVIPAEEGGLAWLDGRGEEVAEFGGEAGVGAGAIGGADWLGGGFFDSFGVEELVDAFLFGGECSCGEVEVGFVELERFVGMEAGREERPFDERGGLHCVLVQGLLELVLRLGCG